MAGYFREYPPDNSTRLCRRDDGDDFILCSYFADVLPYYHLAIASTSLVRSYQAHAAPGDATRFYLIQTRGDGRDAICRLPVTTLLPAHDGTAAHTRAASPAGHCSAATCGHISMYVNINAQTRLTPLRRGCCSSAPRRAAATSNCGSLNACA